MPVLSFSWFGGGGRRDSGFPFIEYKHNAKHEDDNSAPNKNCYRKAIHGLILSSVIIAKTVPETLDSCCPERIIEQRGNILTYESVEQAKNDLLDRIGAVPHLAVIMGSGLSAVDEILRDTIRIHYATIPHFRIPKVPGHRGQVVFGRVGGLNVIVFEGRVHYYEGYSMDDVTFCARVVGRSGAKTLLLTNAAGAINP